MRNFSCLKPLFLFLSALFFFTAACASLKPAAPTVVFLSDFGVKDSAVSVCKGVMWEIAPHLRIVDLSHEVTPYDIEEAGRLVEQTASYYPTGAVFVAVVDPGVGGRRKAIAARSKKGRFFVGPDNGLFSAVLEREGLDAAVEITQPRYLRREDPSATFHGRDLFSPAGAHLAAGVALEALGPRVDRLAALTSKNAVLKDGVIQGRVSYIEDPYGNVVTDIARELLEKAGMRVGDFLTLSIGGKQFRLPFKNTFSDVPEGFGVALLHSRGALSFSINQGNFTQVYLVKAHDPVLVWKAD